MSDLTEALKEAYASATPVVIFETIELRHPAFLDESDNPIAIRLVKDDLPLVATLEDDAPMNSGEEVTFEAMGFDLILPDQVEQNSDPELQLSIDNASAELMPYLDAAIDFGQSIEVTYRVFLEGDLGQPQSTPLTLVLRNIQADVARVSASAAFIDVANKAFPVGEYDDANFPSLIAQ
jgi:hypothetical protein